MGYVTVVGIEHDNEDDIDKIVTAINQTDGVNFVHVDYTDEIEKECEE